MVKRKQPGKSKAAGKQRPTAKPRRAKAVIRTLEQLAPRLPAAAHRALLTERLDALRPDEPMAVRRENLRQKLETLLPNRPTRPTNPRGRS